MLLADGVILIVAGLFVIGLLGFFGMVVALTFRAFARAFRFLVGSESDEPVASPHGAEVGIVCPSPRCGHLNPAAARFCGRCGRPLGQHDDVDAYG